MFSLTGTSLGCRREDGEGRLGAASTPWPSTLALASEPLGTKQARRWVSRDWGTVPVPTWTNQEHPSPCRRSALRSS